MKKLLIVSLVIMGLGFAANKECKMDKKAEMCGTKNCEVMCPVEGNKMMCEKAGCCQKHNKETYFFCGEDCKKEFNKNKKKYVNAHKKMKAAYNAEEVICPVMGEKITPATAVAKAEHAGKIYYLCCAKCEKEFAKNPKKWVKNYDKLMKKAEKKAEKK